VGQFRYSAQRIQYYKNQSKRFTHKKLYYLR